MTLALSDLITASTRDEVVGTILSIATDLSLAVTAWQSGQPVRTVLAVVSQKIADTTEANIEVIKGGLLDTAEEGWLTLLALSLYRVTRLEATYASGSTFRVTNAGTANVEYAALEMIVAHEVTGKTYRNPDALVLVPGVNDDISIVADEVGTDSNAAAGKVTQIGNANLTCTNVGAILGEDEETDPELRTRCREKLGALSAAGPKEIYAFIAKTELYSATATRITRVSPVTDPVTGEISCYLATASGAPSAADVTIVDEAFDRWATPWCTGASAVAAEDLVIPITYEVWVKGSALTVAQIETAIELALIAYFKTIPIGGDIVDAEPLGQVRQGILELVIGRTIPEIIKVVVSLPADDVDLQEEEVAVLGTILPTVTVET